MALVIAAVVWTTRCAPYWPRTARIDADGEEDGHQGADDEGHIGGPVGAGAQEAGLVQQFVQGSPLFRVAMCIGV